VTAVSEQSAQCIHTLVAQLAHDDFVESHRRLDYANSVASSRQQFRDEQQIGEEETAHVSLHAIQAQSATLQIIDRHLYLTSPASAPR